MGAPRLIALPGTLLDGRSLERMLHRLDTRTLLLGTHGHIDDEVDHLASQAGPGAVVWLGHSLGGIVALHLALRHPDKVAGLVLLGANARAGRDNGQARRTAQWTLAQQQGLQALAHSKLAPGYGLAEDDAALDSLVAQADTVGLKRFENQLAYARQRPGLLEPRRALHLPVLVLSGELDTLCPPAHSDEIVALVAPPHPARHHTLAGAGHLFPMQQPALAAGPLHAFVNRLKESHP